jgi:hypothetical protein
LNTNSLFIVPITKKSLFGLEKLVLQEQFLRH